LRTAAYLCGVIALGILAGCGATTAATSSTKPAPASTLVTVQGAYDNQDKPTRASCSGAAPDIVLSRTDGGTVAQQRSTITWRDGMCVFPFSFSHVPPMALYRIRVSAGPDSTWLTPQQVARPALLSFHDGFYIGVLTADSAAQASQAGVSGLCPAGQPLPAASAISPAGGALLARLLPMPVPDAPNISVVPQGVLSLSGFAKGVAESDPVYPDYLSIICFQTAVHRAWRSPDGIITAVYLVQCATTADARAYVSFTEQGDAQTPPTEVFPVPGVVDGVGFADPEIDKYGNTFTEALGDVGNVAIDVFLYVPKILDNSGATLVVQQQNALLTSRSS
jgi:hypothetical protein